ncbi:MAG TPA: dihydroorotate dehydrogenase [Bacteroidota bacterium]|nr:dihydroorotate dehydrogenase [Bacteroidota bacterium]
MTDLSVNIGPLRLANPVLVASGTFGYGDELPGLIDLNALGGIVTKSLSRRPRPGNPPPRIVETAGGMLNSIGLANIGVDRFIAEKLPHLKNLSTRRIVNIAAGSIDEYAEVLSILEDQEGIDGYEINVSCPNVKEGGLSFGTDPRMTARITARLRPVTKKALIIKLTPNVTRISEFALAVEAEGADAVSVINTVIGMAIDIRRRVPRLSTTTGGLSGPAIKPIALAKVFETAQKVKIPVIGIGGIASGDDAVEFLLAGASAVQVGTANFVHPDAALRVLGGIRSYCEAQKCPAVRDLIGSLTVDRDNSVIRSWLE